MRLREHTHRLLIDRPRVLTLVGIARTTGLPFNWLSAFSKGAIKAPCADKVQTLYEFLTDDTDRLNFN